MSTKFTPTPAAEAKPKTNAPTPRSDEAFELCQLRENQYGKLMQVAENALRGEIRSYFDAFVEDASVADVAILRDVLSLHKHVRHDLTVESILPGVFHEIAVCAATHPTEAMPQL